MSSNICKRSKLLLATFATLVIIPISIIKSQEAKDLLSETWGSTHIKISKTKYTWSINNLSLCCQKVGDSLQSPTFSSKDGCKWYLNISPKGDKEENKKFVALFLFSVNCSKKTITKMSILNAKGEETNTREFSQQLEPGKNGGFTDFILQTKLSNETNGYLVNNKLTITCEIETTEGKENSLRKFAQSKQYLMDDFGRLFENQVLTDVTLIAGGKEFRAHKAILLARSPVFKALFEDDTGKGNDTVVEIMDVDPKAMSEMLRYIYTEEVSNLVEVAPYLLGAAENYKLAGLKTLCENTLRANLSIENAVQFLILGDKYCADKLKKQAEKFIIDHASDIANTAGFRSMILTHPRLAVETFALIG